jgi:hypothetical protein
MVCGAKGFEDLLSWISASVSTANVFLFWSKPNYLASSNHVFVSHSLLLGCHCK